MGDTAKVVGSYSSMSTVSKNGRMFFLGFLNLSLEKSDVPFPFFFLSFVESESSDSSAPVADVDAACDTDVTSLSYDVFKLDWCSSGASGVSSRGVPCCLWPFALRMSAPSDREVGSARGRTALDFASWLRDCAYLPLLGD